MAKFTKPELSEKVKNIILRSSKLEKWRTEFVDGEQFFVLTIGVTWRQMRKKFRVETISKDTIAVKSIPSFWDIGMLISSAFLVCCLVASIETHMGVGATIAFSIVLLFMLTFYVGMYILAWRTIKRSIERIR